MKKIVTCTFIVSLLLLAGGCSKTSVNNSSSATFIKVIQTNNNIINVSTLMLSDGNYLLLGKDPANKDQGLMVKTDINGNILWQKSLSPALTILWKAISTDNDGFVAAGFDATQNGNILNVVTYDGNGNILSTNTFTPPGTSLTECSNYPLDMIRLNNGGFALAGSASDGENYPIPFMLITDNSFNNQHWKTYDAYNNPYVYSVSGLSQSSDGTIDIAGFFNSYKVDNPILISANYINGGMKNFFNYFNDSTNYTTVGCITRASNGNILLATAEADINADQGQLVNYKNTSLDVVSGTIGIMELDAAGNYISSAQYSDYPKNGLINSIQPTSDGGFVLCGTVNQQSSVAISNTEIYVLKVDAGLNKQWSNSYNTNYPSYGTGALQAADGGYLISGYQFSFDYTFNMVLIKTDANGNVNQ